MWERRPLLGALIGLTLCISLWRMTFQEPQIYTEYIPNYNNRDNDTTATADAASAAAAASSSSASPAIVLSDLPPNDMNTLVDLNDFTFLMNQNVCASAVDTTAVAAAAVAAGHENRAKSLNTIVLIHSAPKNWNKRMTIRETWGSVHQNSRILFLLGAVTSNDLQHRLVQENNLFNDIVQGNFIDAYVNMTYKHVMALKWFTYYCPQAKYLLKTDDDVFVHTPNVYDYLDSRPMADRRNFLFCEKLENARISRSYRSKWRVSVKEYPGRYYPIYCPGFSIIYSADVAFALYREAQRHQYFWIDDVHITGTLAQAANITITSFMRYYLTKSQRNSLINGYLDRVETMFLFTSPNLTEDTIRLLWRLISIDRFQIDSDKNNNIDSR